MKFKKINKNKNKIEIRTDNENKIIKILSKKYKIGRKQ